MSNKSNFESALKYIPGGVNSPVRAFRAVGGVPFFTQSAHGCHLVTSESKKLLDFVGTWGPAIHGHNHPEIKAEILAAVEKGTSFGTPNEYEIPMAEMLCRVIPSVEKVRMVNSGTEATMSAIRLARGYTNRSKIIKFEGCYHGHSDALLVKAGSGVVTHGSPDSAGVTQGAAQDTLLLPFNDTAKLESVFESQGNEIAAVILEPYPANMGLVLPEQGFLQTLRTLTTKHNSLLIFDEVMTGFRLALHGVQGIEQITPDLSAFGKIIGGGMPVGAFGGKASIMDYLAPEGPVYQAGTLSGNPIALAAGLKAVSMLESSNPYADLESMGAQLVSALKQAFMQKGIAASIPQVGSMFSIFFAEQAPRNFDEVMSSQRALFVPLFKQALARDVFIPPSAFETWFLCTAHERFIEEASEKLTAAILAI